MLTELPNGVFVTIALPATESWNSFVTPNRGDGEGPRE